MVSSEGTIFCHCAPAAPPHCVCPATPPDAPQPLGQSERGRAARRGVAVDSEARRGSPSQAPQPGRTATRVLIETPPPHPPLPPGTQVLASGGFGRPDSGRLGGYDEDRRPPARLPTQPGARARVRARLLAQSTRSRAVALSKSSGYF